jgi:hypothetical protein
MKLNSECQVGTEVYSNANADVVLCQPKYWQYNVSNSAIRVLVACEYSGVVRDAFCQLGFYAWSCDLLDTESLGNHIKGNVLDVLNDGWDLMIAHPPCTYLTFAANNWLNVERHGLKALERHKKRVEAFEFFVTLWNAPVKHICIENPRGYPMQFIKQSQIIQPNYFGDRVTKATCLWLKNLPLLEYSKENNLFGEKTIVDVDAKYFKKTGKRISWTDSFSPSKDRAKLRSKTFQGIANAMASQWGEYLLRSVQKHCC